MLWQTLARGTESVEHIIMIASYHCKSFVHKKVPYAKLRKYQIGKQTAGCHVPGRPGRRMCPAQLRS